MLKKILKIIGFVFSVIFFLIASFLIYFNWPTEKNDQKINLGITYSWRYAGEIGLDWQEAYVAVLDDLQIKKIRLPIYWDSIEEKEGVYDFSKVDWQLEEAKKRNAEVILVVGQKVPRWPECFVPEWAKNDDQKRKSALLNFVRETVLRYRENETVKYWQVENEPFLKFGICPDLDVDILDSEINLVRLLDPSRKIIITDSGELSLWISAARRADIFGTTMYRTIWKEGFGYFDYPIGPRFFHFKKWLIKKFADQENSIVVELQTEPWVAGWTTSAPLAVQFESMNVEKLTENIDFASRSGFSEVYLWGAEWWYWLKTEKDHPEFWEKIKQLNIDYEKQN